MFCIGLLLELGLHRRAGLFPAVACGPPITATPLVAEHGRLGAQASAAVADESAQYLQLLGCRAQAQ